MICNQCGRENPDGSNFCSGCQADLRSQSVQNNPIGSAPASGEFIEYPTTGQPTVMPQAVVEVEAPKNMLKPFLFAIIGGIPGIILWVVLGLIGYVWSFIGAIIGFGVFFGYTKAGGDFSKFRSVAIWILIVAVELYLGIHLVWSATFYIEWNKLDIPLSLGTSVFGLYDLLSLSDDISADQESLRAVFIVDVVKTYVFGAIGCVGVFRRRIKK